MALGLRLEGLGEGAALAEQAGLDFVHLAGTVDGSIGCDPLSVAACLMTTTRRIGLVASVPTRWAPFNVARALASFDLLSGGRCGWLPVVDGADVDPAREAEHLDVVLQLFDSWDDDALVFDKSACVFADPDKVRRIRHEGAYFSVDGPLNAPRPPQGRPVLMQPLTELSPAADMALIDLDQLGPDTRARVGSARLLALVALDSARGAGPVGRALGERLARTYTEGRCDGFVFRTAQPLIDMPMLADEAIPMLKALSQDIGTEPGGGPAIAADAGDFRSRLGLPRPANRFAPPPTVQAFP